MELRRQLRVRAIIALTAAVQIFAAAFGVITLTKPATSTAAQSVPYLINFQGRLTDNSGNILSDGSYNVRFRLFNDPSAGTNLWQADRTFGASDHRVTIQNGLFNIQFGDTSKGDPALSPSLFNNQTYPTLYLEVELPTPATATCATNGCASWTEGAMTPRQPLASSPYAFNSDTLDGLDATAFGQLSAVQSWTDTNTYSKSGGAAIVLSGTAASGGSILQIGSALSGGSASGTLFGANTASSGDLLNLQVSGGLRLKVDNSGSLTTGGSITAGGSIQLSQGANRTLSVAQATSGAGYNLTITAGQSNTGAVNGGDLVLQAGATGGSGTSGSVIVRANGTETATAFQVQNASSAPAFTIDTVANKVVIGDATGTDADTSLLVIDTATADPATGYNGAMFYNSTTGTFRCYQAGAWANCSSGGGTITATSNSTASFTSGLANVGANLTGTAVETLLFTAATTVSNTAGVTGFTAPAAGSFRSCLTKNTAAVTGGTLNLRWRVNGVSVGAAACTLNATTNRQSSTALDNGVVTFAAGDTIGIAYDTVNLAPTTNDFTTFWSVEYNSSSGNGVTLQFVYDNSSSPATINLASSKDLVVNAADTATDASVLFDLQCVTCSVNGGRFAIQNNGTDAFAVNPNNGGITLGQDTTLGAGKSLSLTSGSGTLNQAYTTATAGSGQSLSFANTNTGAGITVQGIDLTPTNTSSASSGTNTLNLLNFAAGGALGGSNITNGLNFASTTGYTNFIKTPTFNLGSSGDLTADFTALNGTSTANGAGTSSTSLTLASATSFDVGNYVQMNSANCGGTGINPCYAKITAKVSNTLTISPALTWANGSTVNEYHLPEIGGTNTASTLANRYGRGYFVSGVAAGNGTTFYNADGISTSLAAYELLNSPSLTNLTIGTASTTVTLPGTLDAASYSVGGTAGAAASCSGGQVIQNPVFVSGILTGGSCATLSGGGGANVNLSNVTATSISASLVANANNSLDLGSAGTVWNDLFVSNVDAGTTTTTLTIGTAATTTALTIGRVGLAPSLPGGLTTSGGDINAGTGTITGNGSGLTDLNPTSLATGSGAVNLASGGGLGLTLTSASNTISVAATTIQRAAAALTLDLATAAASTLTVTNSNASFVANLSVEGGVGIGTGQVFSVGATNGSTIAACSSAQYMSAGAATGGLVTGGSCTTADLQNAYANGATINLTDNRNLTINAADTTTDSSVIFNLQCATCSANGGRFAIQDNSTDVFTVNPNGSIAIAPSAGQNLAITQAGSSGTRITASSVPTVDQFNIDNTSTTGVATNGVNGMSINYRGSTSAIATGIEASGMRIDFAPSTVNPTSGTNTWSGMRIVAAATGATSNNVENGLKLEGPTTPGAGLETAIDITTGWDVGVDIGSGGLQLATQSDPTTPASGDLRVYAKLVAGRSMLRAKSPTGVTYSYQPSLFEQYITYVGPGNGATPITNLSTFGTSWTESTPAQWTLPAPSQALGMMVNVATTATSGNAQALNTTANQFYRGSTTGANGFFYFARIATPDANYGTGATGSRMFMGLTDQTIATMTAADTVAAGNFAGFQYSTNRDTAIQFIRRDGTNAQVTVNTTVGIGAAGQQNHVYDLYLFTAPQGGTIFWRVDDLTAGTSQEGNVSTNLPTATAAMKAGIGIQTLTTTARNLRMQKIYVEADR